MRKSSSNRDYFMAYCPTLVSRLIQQQTVVMMQEMTWNWSHPRPSTLAGQGKIHISFSYKGMEWSITEEVTYYISDHSNVHPCYQQSVTCLSQFLCLREWRECIFWYLVPFYPIRIKNSLNSLCAVFPDFKQGWNTSLTSHLIDRLHKSLA